MQRLTKPIIQLRFGTHALAFGALCMLVACGGPASTPVTSTVEPTTEATSSARTISDTTVRTGDPQQAQQPTTEPTEEVTEFPATPSPQRVVIWWPDVLAPAGNEDVMGFLDEQIALFEGSEGGRVQVDLRRRRVGDVGGILQTLRTGSEVAPGAMPTLTLMRREDLLTAVRERLIQPLEGRVSSAVLSDLFGPAVLLGSLDGDLYGLPYTLTVQHAAYSGLTTDNAGLTFDTVLDADLPFIFPAGRSTGINTTLLLQYYAAGGEPLTTDSTTINTEALLTVLQFYEQAVALGVVDTSVLEFTTMDDYRLSLTSEDAGPSVSIVDSSIYLDWVDQGRNPGFAYIPTSGGQGVTTLSGWMWVLVSAEDGEEQAALRFLNWMFDAQRQAQYNSLINRLPSQRTAFTFWEEQDYAAFVGSLLPNAILPPSDNAGGVVARAMQTAFVAVINQERTAEEAVADVEAQLAQ